MKSLNLKNTLPFLPEMLLFIAIAISFLGELIETSSVNYFMIACALILVTLIIWKNKYFALSLSILLGLFSFFMLFAVVSEYREFPPGDTKGLQLILAGGSMFTSLTVISFFIPKKYFAGAKEA